MDRIKIKANGTSYIHRGEYMSISMMVSPVTGVDQVPRITPISLMDILDEIGIPHTQLDILTKTIIRIPDSSYIRHNVIPIYVNYNDGEIKKIILFDLNRQKSIGSYDLPHEAMGLIHYNDNNGGFYYIYKNPDTGKYELYVFDTNIGMDSLVNPNLPYAIGGLNTISPSDGGDVETLAYNTKMSCAIEPPPDSTYYLVLADSERYAIIYANTGIFVYDIDKSDYIMGITFYEFYEPYPPIEPIFSNTMLPTFFIDEYNAVIFDRLYCRFVLIKIKNNEIEHIDSNEIKFGSNKVVFNTVSQLFPHVIAYGDVILMYGPREGTSFGTLFNSGGGIIYKMLYRYYEGNFEYYGVAGIVYNKRFEYFPSLSTLGLWFDVSITTDMRYIYYVPNFCYYPRRAQFMFMPVLYRIKISNGLDGIPSSCLLGTTSAYGGSSYLLGVYGGGGGIH